MRRDPRRVIRRGAEGFRRRRARCGVRAAARYDAARRRGADAGAFWLVRCERLDRAARASRCDRRAVGIMRPARDVGARAGGGEDCVDRGVSSAAALRPLVQRCRRALRSQRSARRCAPAGSIDVGAKLLAAGAAADRMSMSACACRRGALARGAAEFRGGVSRDRGREVVMVSQLAAARSARTRANTTRNISVVSTPVFVL